MSRAPAWRCRIGIHRAPDPATPPDRRYYRSRSYDCGYPPYAWECRDCGRFYGRHQHAPFWFIQNAEVAGRLSVVDGGRISLANDDETGRLTLDGETE